MASTERPERLLPDSFVSNAASEARRAPAPPLVVAERGQGGTRALPLAHVTVTAPMPGPPRLTATSEAGPASPVLSRSLTLVAAPRLDASRSGAAAPEVGARDRASGAHVLPDSPVATAQSARSQPSPLSRPPIGQVSPVPAVTASRALGNTVAASDALQRAGQSGPRVTPTIATDANGPPSGEHIREIMRYLARATRDSLSDSSTWESAPGLGAE
jgi:hypothetical protein